MNFEFVNIASVDTKVIAPPVNAALLSKVDPLSVNELHDDSLKILPEVVV